MKGVAIVSGGLDSTTMVYQLHEEGHYLHLLSFDYGQRHNKEIVFAKLTAKQLGYRHDVIDLTGLTHLISNSALTSPTVTTLGLLDKTTEEVGPLIEVPEGHYAEENMKLTVVPNRNMIMLSIAAGVAVNEKAQYIATAAHAGDHFVYPDCRPDFMNCTAMAIVAGTDGFNNFDLSTIGPTAAPIWAPYINWSKADIACRALELGVPLHLTWSCYKGGDNHCGRCGTCVERLEAVYQAINRWNVGHDWNAQLGPNIDATVYDDTEYWKVAVREAKK